MELRICDFCSHASFTKTWCNLHDKEIDFDGVCDDWKMEVINEVKVKSIKIVKGTHLTAIDRKLIKYTIEKGVMSAWTKFKKVEIIAGTINRGVYQLTIELSSYYDATGRGAQWWTHKYEIEAEERKEGSK